MNEFATGGLEPDLTFLLEVDLEAAAGRAGEADRFEDEGSGLQRAVAEAYVQLAHGPRWRRVDASRAPGEVHAQVLAEVSA